MHDTDFTSAPDHTLDRMAMAPAVLVVDADPMRLDRHQSALRRAGHPVTTAGSGRQALGRLDEAAHGAVVMALDLPDCDGLELLSSIRRRHPGTAVIVTAGRGQAPLAEAAGEAGARAILLRPFTGDQLIGAIGTMLQPEAPARPAVPGFAGLIGTSAAIAGVRDRAQSAAASLATVFLTGESGTGKELCARLIHKASPRGEGDFVVFDCSLPGRGAASDGAAVPEIGAAAAAARDGTLFLDNICDLDPARQARLLELLRGADQGMPVPRLICATRRNPVDRHQDAVLRDDLFYRLHVLTIHMPPLRSMGADVLAIADHLLARCAAEEGRDFLRLSGDAAQVIAGYRWPGNVQQLANAIRAAVILNEAEELTAAMLPDWLTAASAAEATGPGPDLDGFSGRSLAEIERLVIEHALKRNEGSVTRTARVLDVAPSTLYRKLDAWRGV
jgi:DNA-binding NtrC family response regulator